VLLSFGERFFLPLTPYWHAATWHPKSRGQHSKKSGPLYSRMNSPHSKKESSRSKKSIVDAVSYSQDMASPVVEAASLRDAMASPPGGSAVGNMYTAAIRHFQPDLSARVYRRCEPIIRPSPDLPQKARLWLPSLPSDSRRCCYFCVCTPLCWQYRPISIPPYLLTCRFPRRPARVLRPLLFQAS
jgi:hypothetical protein